jgi:hypothetical protein
MVGRTVLGRVSVVYYVYNKDLFKSSLCGALGMYVESFRYGHDFVNDGD